jgi:hypothetical protein
MMTREEHRLNTKNMSPDDMFDYLYTSLELLQSPKTCDGCQYEHLDRYGDNHCKFENMCMRDFDDYYKAKEIK